MKRKITIIKGVVSTKTLKESKVSRKGVKRTKPEEKMGRILDEMGISYEREFPLPYLNKKKIYDFRLEGQDILIEVDGDYFHGNEEGDKPLNYMQIQNKKNDMFKNLLGKAKGYEIFRVWESEINVSEGMVKKKLQQFIDEKGKKK